MISIFLSINNNEEVLQLPVPPAKYPVTSLWNNEQVDGLQQSLNIIGLKGLRAVEIESFFPVDGHDYPFLQNREMWGMAYVDTLERWRERRFPVRLVITDREGRQDLNMAVTIDEFEWEVRQDGDIYYTLKMTEFLFINVRR
jgi:hypothetical protein